MANPFLTCEVKDTNPTTVALTGDSSMLIRGRSTAQVTMIAEAYDGASINLDTCVIRNGDQTEYGMEATFYNVDSNEFSLSAEDSEGRYSHKVVLWRMVEYINLTCNMISGRPDGSGDMYLQCSGDYFNGSFGLRTNTLSVKYRYRIRNGAWSSYANMTVSTSGNYYTAYASFGGLDYTQTYDFQVLAEDALMQSSDISGNVKSLPVFHWGEDDVAFEVPAEFKKGIVSPLQIGTSAECLISATGSGLLAIAAPQGIIMSAPNFLYNNKIVAFSESGTWTPSTSASGVYWSQYGWYSKTGNVVTVGFHIKIYPDTSYNYQNIAIYGLPFTPAYPCAGGGLCSGAFVVGGFNFQCFVAETNGLITTRIQACNNTASTNLATSAQGCQYYSSYELTLSGTITYMTA